MAIKITRKRKTSQQTWRRKKSRKMMSRRALRANTQSQTYAFKRFQFKDTITPGDGNTFAKSYDFRLEDLSNYTEFTALFDQFKIAGIKYRWVVNRNPDFGGTVVSNVYNTVVQGQYPRIMWVHDYDGGAAPANYAELQQYPRMKEVYLTPDRPYTKWYYVKPARLAVDYESATLSAYRPIWKGFIDAASTATPHYGIRCFGDAVNTNVQLRLECWYYLVMKNVR